MAETLNKNYKNLYEGLYEYFLYEIFDAPLFEEFKEKVAYNYDLIKNLVQNLLKTINNDNHF